MANLKTPMCDKLLAAKDERAAITSFLDYLSDQGIMLSRWRGEDLEGVGSSAGLVLQYLGIDEDQLKMERCAILDAQRRANEK